jgi:hypothetical protein
VDALASLSRCNRPKEPHCRKGANPLASLIGPDCSGYHHTKVSVYGFAPLSGCYGTGKLQTQNSIDGLRALSGRNRAGKYLSGGWGYPCWQRGRT